jgi:MoxR-like ATPase
MREALRDRGGHVFMYGDTGVGKSSLLKYAAEDEDMMPFRSSASRSVLMS